MLIFSHQMMGLKVTLETIFSGSRYFTHKQTEAQTVSLQSQGLFSRHNQVLNPSEVSFHKPMMSVLDRLGKYLVVLVPPTGSC